MSLLSEFKGNVVLSTDTGTSTKVNKIDANLATPASSTVMSIGSNIVGGTIKIGENIENPGTLLLGNAATGTSPQITNIVQVQGRFQSNFLRTKNTNDALAIADDQSAGGTVSIGSASTVTTMNGTLKTDTIVPITAGGTTTINTSGNGSTTIGTSGGTGDITVNRPITIGYTLPSLSSQLGYSLRSAPASDVALATNNSGSSQTITSFTLPAGTWMCAYQIRYFTGGVTTFTQLSTNMLLNTPIWANNNGWVISNVTQVCSSKANMAVSGSGIIYTSFSQTLFLMDNSIYTGTSSLVALGGFNQTYLIATRIA